MKELICLLPGLTDKPLGDLGGLSPLEKARTPCIDHLASEGEVLAVRPPEVGGFATALLALLSGQPQTEPVALGPLEAAALGIRLAPNQVAYSVRLVSIGQGVIVDVSDHLVGDKEAKALFQALNRDHGSKGLHWMHLQGPQGVLIASREPLLSAPRALGLNPIEALQTSWNQWAPGYEELQEQLIDTLNAHEINELRLDLEEPLVNGLLLLEGGTRPDWSKLQGSQENDLFYGISPSLMGIAKALDISVRKLPAETRRFDRIPEVLETLEESFQEVDRVILEVPYLWTATYEGDLRSKVKSLEWLDTHLIKPIAQLHTFLTLCPLKHVDITLGQPVAGLVPILRYLGPAKSVGKRGFSDRFADSESGLPLHELLLTSTCSR